MRDLSMPLKGRVSVQGACAWLLPVPRPQLHRILGAMLAVGPCPWLDVDLYLVRDGRMAGINRQHMQCSGPTNILSFPAVQDPQHEQPKAGNVATLVLSVDSVQREALLYGQEPQEYTVWLLAHGMGHLMGYDHGPDMDALCAELFSAGLASL